MVRRRDNVEVFTEGGAFGRFAMVRRSGEDQVGNGEEWDVDVEIDDDGHDEDVGAGSSESAR